MVKQFLLVVCCGLALAMAQEDNFKCPDEFEGFYPHLYSCDKYWHCKSGSANLKLCGNGLAFDDIDPTYTSENCDYLHNVDCGNRTDLEPAISAPNCPRLYGTFPDPEDCTGFFNCRDGLSNRYSCAPGLAFDPKDRVCKWADQVKACKKSAADVESDDEAFQCPTNTPAGIFTKHPHPEDCRQYYVCISGVPREYGCPLGTVFKVGPGENDGKCSDPEDVPECSNYYGDLAFDKQDLVRAGVDPEAVGAQVAAAKARVAPSPRPTAAPAPKAAPVRVAPVVVEEEEESDDQPFDTELRIQDLPKPDAPLNAERARVRSRPPSVNAAPVAQSTAAPANAARPANSRFTLSNRPVPTTTEPPTTTGAPPTTTTSATTLIFEESSTVGSTDLPNASLAPVEDIVEEIEEGKLKAADLPAATGERKPAKVKAGDDYYYYYYYYDDDEEKGADATATVTASPAPAQPAAA